MIYIDTSCLLKLVRIEAQSAAVGESVSNETEVLVSEKPQTVTITNQGDAVELIAVELIGKNLEQIKVVLPAFPLMLKKGEKLLLPISAKADATAGEPVKLRLETVLGPVPDFELELKGKPVK